MSRATTPVPRAFSFGRPQKSSAPLLAGLLLALMACDGSIDDPTVDTPIIEPTAENVSEPVRDSIGSATLPPGRSMRRMSAAQFNASLEIATGQRWSDYERYAAALGRADFAEITEEGAEFNVTFEKLVEDAARKTCRAAVAADIAGAEDPAILRHASTEDLDEATLVENLEYLLLRFHGSHDLTGASDERVEPWLNLLLAERPGMEIDAEVMQARWTAVCVGLVTHPEFVSY